MNALFSSPTETRNLESARQSWGEQADHRNRPEVRITVRFRQSALTTPDRAVRKVEGERSALNNLCIAVVGGSGESNRHVEIQESCDFTEDELATLNSFQDQAVENKPSIAGIQLDEPEKEFSETGATVENFSTLSERLEQIEAEHIGLVNVDILGARHTLVAALGQYRTSRFLLGEALAAYKRQFAAKNDHSAGDRGWMAAAKSVAEAMGRDERTVRNIIADYERTASLPGTVIQAAQARGIDLAQRRYRPAVAAIESIIENDGHGQDAIDAEEADRIVSNVLVMPPPDQREQVQDDPFVPLTREEKQRFAVRMKIRTALTNVEPDQKLSTLISALEEEMFAIWGQSDPVTVTITPRTSGLTLDGRKRREDVA